MLQLTDDQKELVRCWRAWATALATTKETELKLRLQVVALLPNVKEEGTINYDTSAGHLKLVKRMNYTVKDVNALEDLIGVIGSDEFEKVFKKGYEVRSGAYKEFLEARGGQYQPDLFVSSVEIKPGTPDLKG